MSWFNRQVFQLSDVFVAGPTPTVTFVDRSNTTGVKDIAYALEQRGRIVIVTGPAKSGKTVLSASQILKNRSPVQIHASGIESVGTLWRRLADALHVPTNMTTEVTNEVATGSDRSLQLGSPSSLAAAKVGAQFRTARQERVAASWDDSSQRIVAQELAENRIPILIDDFHWITSDALQGELLKSLKPCLQQGVTVVLTSVAELRHKEWRSIVDLSALCNDVKVPQWSHEELGRIPQLGFEALNVTLSPRVISILARYSYRNPMLMQEYCSRLAYNSGIGSTGRRSRSLEPNDDALRSVFLYVADRYGEIYRRFGETLGEKSWNLTSGQKANIYEVIFLALAHVWVMVPIGIDTLMQKMNDLLLINQPARLKIVDVVVAARRVGRDMSETLGDRSPLSYDESTRTVNILDPLFKAYLAWRLSPKLLGDTPPLVPSG